MPDDTGSYGLRGTARYAALCAVMLLASAAARASDFNFAQLQSELSDHQVHTVEGLLALLPESMRSHYALVFASRSLQSASFENPRAILYGTDARFIVTFNGQPAQRGYDAVEVAEFRADTQHFELHEIRFSRSGDAAVEYSAANPPQCLGCHGSPARPLWDSAPLWPGAYGERYLEPLSAPERDGIARFLQQQPSHPRYRQLLGSTRFGLRDLYVPGAHSRYDGNAEEPPNADFSRLLAALNARRIAAELSAQPAFPAFQFALLGAAEADCGAAPAFLPPGVRAEAGNALAQLATSTRSANSSAALIRQHRLSTLADLPATAESNRGASLTEVRYLAQVGLGLSTREWTLAIEQDSYDFSTPGPGVDGLAELLRARMVAADPQLGELAAYRTHGTDDRYCTYLQERSVQSLGAATMPAIHWSGLVAATPTATALLRECAACHAGPAAPALPFANSQTLAAHLHDKGYPRGELLDEIEFRLAPQSGAAHMPLNDNLDEPSRRLLAQYLETLASPSKLP